MCICSKLVRGSTDQKKLTAIDSKASKVLYIYLPDKVRDIGNIHYSGTHGKRHLNIIKSLLILSTNFTFSDALNVQSNFGKL